MKKAAFHRLAGPCCALAVALTAGCGKKSASAEADPEVDALTSRPLPARTSSPDEPLFRRLAPADTGVDFVASIESAHEKSFLYNGAYACGGVALGDFNNDGKPDLFFVGGSDPHRLYLQTGVLEFSDVSDEAGIAANNPWGGGAAAVDINGDGDLDLYVCNYDEPNQLFINQGPDERGIPRFVERARKYGLDLVDASLMPAFCDYDRDGDLDVFVLCYRRYRLRAASIAEFTEKRGTSLVLKPGMEEFYQLLSNPEGQLLILERGRTDYLLRNDDGRFTNVTRSAGIGGAAFGMSSLWWDYDGDGWKDLYVANDLHSADHLYRNQGDGTFRNVIRETVPHTAWFSMGSAAGDLNNDGRPDLFTLDMSGSTHFKEKVAMGQMTDLQKIILEQSTPRQNMRNALLINTGTGRMQEGAYLAGLASTDWSWAPVMGDFDEDGRLDVFVTNGMTRDFMDSDIHVTEEQKGGTYEWHHYRDGAERREQNFAFQNEGELRFTDQSAAWGLDHVGMSFAAASGDLDGDGDPDLVVANLNEPPSLYENRTSKGNRITVELSAAPSGLSSAIGTIVTVRGATTGTQTRTLQPMQGFNTSHQALLHFGLGADEKIEELTVTWPGDSSERHENLDANRHYTIRQSARSRPTKREPPAPVFARAESLAGVRHEDEPYDDFQHQPLLPNRSSQLGPGSAWGDVDGDGDPDFFLGGAAGHAAQLFRNEGGGKFVPVVAAALDADQDCEDTGAVFFDCDGDGDLDLFVGSGSYQFAEGDRAQRDRLYLNDGAGLFTRASSEHLPEIRKVTGPVAACDFDRDGDIDLFTGTRLVSRQYPVSPRSELLINGGGSFAAHADAPSPGLVTSALWADVDNDGWSDLLIACEWGPVWLVRNAQGKLQPAVAITDSGWWNSISAGDLDNDGDLDFVVGNFGLNTKYKTPAALFYGDYLGEGTRHLVEAKFDSVQNCFLPVRGKACSTAAMPRLADKFSSFREFAGATLQQIYSDSSLQSALKLEITELRSGVIRNEGGGEFSFAPLPRLAQISPVMGSALLDFDGDGNLDLCLAENFFAPQRETGRMDGGIGTLLKGDGQGNFIPLPAHQSGIVVPGDAKSLTVADLDENNTPDLVFASNDGPVHVLANATPGSSRLQVDLSPPLPGSRITAVYGSGLRQTQQVAAGSGYFSQNAPSLWFGNADDLKSLEIAWPDGTSEVRPVEPHWLERQRCLLTKPSAVSHVE